MYRSEQKNHVSDPHPMVVEVGVGINTRKVFMQVIA